MVELELQCLFEVGKVTEPAPPVLDRLRAQLGLTISTAPFTAVIHAATDLTWTRDPFDRLIAANALADSADLLTADSTILGRFERAVWDG